MPSRYNFSIRNLVISLLLPIASITAATIPAFPSGSTAEVSSLPQSANPTLEPRRVTSSSRKYGPNSNAKLASRLRKALAVLEGPRVSMPAVVKVPGNDDKLVELPLLIVEDEQPAEGFVPLYSASELSQLFAGLKSQKVEAALKAELESGSSADKKPFPLNPTFPLHSEDDEDAEWAFEDEFGLTDLEYELEDEDEEDEFKDEFDESKGIDSIGLTLRDPEAVIKLDDFKNENPANLTASDFITKLRESENDDPPSVPDVIVELGDLKNDNPSDPTVLIVEQQNIKNDEPSFVPDMIIKLEESENVEPLDSTAVILVQPIVAEPILARPAVAAARQEPVVKKDDTSTDRYILDSSSFTEAGEDEPSRLWVSCVDHGRILYRTFKITWGPAKGDDDNCKKLKKSINKRGLVTNWSCVQEYNFEKKIYQMAAMGHRPQGLYGFLSAAVRETFNDKALSYANSDTKMLCQR